MARGAHRQRSGGSSKMQSSSATNRASAPCSATNFELKTSERPKMESMLGEGKRMWADRPRINQRALRRHTQCMDSFPKESMRPPDGSAFLMRCKLNASIFPGRHRSKVQREEGARPKSLARRILTLHRLFRKLNSRPSFSLFLSPYWRT